MPETSFALDPKDEFESVLIDLVQFQRTKRAQYGSDQDFLWNFYEIGRASNLTPLRAGEVLKNKHESALRKWWQDFDEDQARDRMIGSFEGPADPLPTGASDDAYMDRAVYGILLLILYRRTNAFLGKIEG